MQKSKAPSHPQPPQRRPLTIEWLGQAVEFHKKGDLVRAEDLYRKILSLDRKEIHALHLLGLVMTQTNRQQSGIDVINRALAVKPDYLDALNTRGIALQDLGRFEAALESYDKALAVKPDFVDALVNRGNALNALKRYDAALASFERVLALAPRHAAAWSNRGVALRETKRLEEALASYDKALAIEPDYLDALVNRGNVLGWLRRFDEATACYDRALRIRPGFADAVFNRALAALMRGDFAAGWPGYEARWSTKAPLRRLLEAPLPIWRGQDIAGKKIIVYEEQGLGDILQFCRYLKLLQDRGAQTTLLVRASMAALMRCCAGPARVVSTYPAGQTFDFQSALLSLPLAFGTTLETIPANTPYLRVDPDRSARWKERLGTEGFKVGIAWAGSEMGATFGKCFALSEFLGLSRIPGVRLISLQKGGERLGEAPEDMKVETFDFDAGPDAFLDTAAAMESLDLIVSVDTSIPHLAGSLGRPVCVALPYVADWRWLMDRTDTPWYPTMRLFRQQSRDDWRGVFLEIESAVRQRIG